MDNLSFWIVFIAWLVTVYGWHASRKQCETLIKSHKETNDSLREAVIEIEMFRARELQIINTLSKAAILLEQARDNGFLPSKSASPHIH